MSGRINRLFLQSFIPLNALSDERLDYLLEGQEIEAFSAGSEICRHGESDGRTIYLLSGTLTLVNAGGDTTELDAGDVDASHAVSAGQPHPVTVLAKTAVNVLRLESKRLDRALAWGQSSETLQEQLEALYPGEDGEWISRLLQSRLFYKLPPGNVVELFRRLTTEAVVAGQQILRMGEKAESCYFIREGVADVNIPSERGPMTVALLEKGQYFGEEGLLVEGSRNANVTMVTDGRLMRLDQADFNELLRSPTLTLTDFSSAMSRAEAGQVQWLDVRLNDEQARGVFPRAVCLPLQSLRVKSRLLSKDVCYIVYCDTGRRSAAAAFLLGILGYEVEVLDGGLWSLMQSERDRFLTLPV